ncbi:DUF2235 domain-containing protein [Scytonema sp. NUACC21]
MKRLVVCSEGTWQKLESPYPSNVVKLAQAVKPVADDGIPQIVFYDEGIGTDSNIVEQMLGGATGSGIDKNIQDGYRFLCLNYVPGDEIYLFGFSRGAYTVRSLAGMIYCSGLQSRSYISEAPEAYELYRNRGIKPKDQEAVDYRQEHGERVPIKLLGCFDTVGALGIPPLAISLGIGAQFNQRYKFHDTTLNPCIENALHAMALDEFRDAFTVTPMTKNPKAENQRVRQVWFPGEHGCVGGGTEEYSGLSDAALQWMIDSIRELGLGLDLDPSAIPSGINPDCECDFKNDPGLFLLGGVRDRQVNPELDELHITVVKRWKARKEYRPRSLAKYADKLSEILDKL